MVAFGLLLLANAVWGLSRGESVGRSASQAIIGLLAFWCSFWSRTVSLTSQGILRKSRGMGHSHEELLPWSDVVHLTLAFRGEDMILLVDHGHVRELRIPFRRSQEEHLRSVLSRCLPHGEVETLEK